MDDEIHPNQLKRRLNTGYRNIKDTGKGNSLISLQGECRDDGATPAGIPSDETGTIQLLAELASGGRGVWRGVDWEEARCLGEVRGSSGVSPARVSFVPNSEIGRAHV